MSTRWPKPDIRTATKADIEAFYGEPPSHTTIARIGYVEGEPVGIGGVTIIDGRTIAFCDLKEGARRYKVSLVKAAAEVIETVKATGVRVIYAEINKDEPGARRWVKSLGFRETNNPRILAWRAN